MYKIDFRNGDKLLELAVDDGCLNSAILQNLKDRHNIHLYFERSQTEQEQVDVNQRLSELLKGLKGNRFVFRFENNDETYSEESLQSKQSKTQSKSEKEIRKTQAVYSNQYLINSLQEENSPFNFKIREFLENYCHTQVAILLDSTHSMKAHLDFSLRLIYSLFEDNQIIQQQKTKYAAVCYYDKLEEKINKNPYPFIQFTKVKDNIFEFLSKVNFFGGGDEAEDVKGGIEDLCNNLEWNSVLKIAVLICDSPSHGRLWAGNVLDFHQYIDLKPALQRLIDKNIILVGIQFNDKTKQMYQQMKIFYKNQGKQDYLLIIELESNKQINLQINNHLQAFLTKQQNQISQQQVINKINQQIINNFLENNKNQQISNSQIIEEISLIGDSFISLYQNQKIQQNDFYIKKCNKMLIIDSNLCQFQNQRVNLAQSINYQNQNINRLFTINSIPYQTIDQVILTQQIYFITKNLYDSFKFTLQQKNDQLTQIELEEKQFYKKSEFQIYQMDQYFLDEKYKLYNHNRGFVLDEDSELNYILQSFSLYTLYKSQSRFIILNIKTIDNYICTPTLNTFDQQQSLENGGQQAIYQFINNLMKIKNQCNEYLKYFGIELEF